jgi:hypothetical protein
LGRSWRRFYHSTPQFELFLITGHVSGDSPLGGAFLQAFTRVDVESKTIKIVMISSTVPQYPINNRGDAVSINRLRFQDAAPEALESRSSSSAGAFMAMPWGLFCGAPGEPAIHQLLVYQAALQQARAVVQPSLPERDLLACWN